MFRKSLLILKNNMLYIQPLWICFFIVSMVSVFIVTRESYIQAQIVLLIATLLLWIAFCTGWFYINKLALLSYDEKDTKEEITIKSINNFKKFFEGIGENFFKILPASIVIAIIYIVIIFGTTELCTKAFGEPKLILELPQLAKATSQAEMLNILNNVTPTDKLIFTSWVMTFTFVTSVLNFFCLLYFTVNMFEKDNIFKNLWTSIKFFFLNFLKSVLVIFFVFILYLCLNLLSVLLGSNPFSFVILLLLFTMYLNYYLLLVFCMYNEKREDNSNNRTEFIG